MKRFIMLLAVLLTCKFAQAATSTVQPFVLPAVVSVSSISLTSSAATVTISTPTGIGAYSTGYYNYLSHVRIEMYAASALTGGATPTTCTTTGLQSLAFKMPTALAVGALYIVDLPLDNPLQAAQASNVVISCPATTNVIWNIVGTYYQGQ